MAKPYKETTLGCLWRTKLTQENSIPGKVPQWSMQTDQSSFFALQSLYNLDDVLLGATKKVDTVGMATIM